MLAMILGVNIFINSGFLDFIINIFDSIFTFVSIPEKIVPIALIRPISGSASLAVLSNIYSDYGPDSLLGVMGSIMQGSTDTTFYIITLYFGSVGVRKIRYALISGLLADFIGIVVSIIISKTIFC